MSRRCVWKFPLAVANTQDVEMPRRARLLAVQVQGDTVMVWAMVDPDAERVKRRIAIIGTGHEIPAETAELPYVGTYQLFGGGLVFHVLDLGERS